MNFIIEGPLGIQLQIFAPYLIKPTLSTLFAPVHFSQCSSPLLYQNHLKIKFNNIKTRVINSETIINLSLHPYSIQNFHINGIVYRQLKNSISALKTALVWRKDETTPIVHNFLNLSKEIFTLT